MGAQRKSGSEGPRARGASAKGPGRPPAGRPGEAALKRAAVELVARHDSSLRQMARRYSLCADDAEDAYQRALEILLTKAPTHKQHELIRWTHTVVKHEALAIRRNRQRMLGGVPVARDGKDDWLALVPAAEDGPDERVERREKVARSREALQALKPAELQALTLLAEGYTYAEIGEITGFSQTKVNRSLAEGRERFRRLLSHSEDGSRCREMRSMLSSYCDGEASPEKATRVREHLRACAACRAAMRAYRAAPGAAAALAPALPVSQSLLERTQEALIGLQMRLTGLPGTTDSTVAQAAAGGGSRGVGMAAVAKVLAICAGTAGGAAACVATGVAPAPLELPPERASPAIERAAAPPAVAEPEAEIEPVGSAPDPEPSPPPEPEAAPEPEPQPAPQAPPPVEAGAVEYEPPPPAPPPSAPAPTEPSSSSPGSAAGEFGP